MTVSWELDRYDVMNVKGEIQEKNIAEKGTLVKTECGTYLYGK